MYLQYVGVFPFPHSLNNDPRAVRLRLARGHRLWRLIPGSMARSLQKGSAVLWTHLQECRACQHR